MKKQIINYLEKMLNAPSPSGYEDQSRAIWRAEMEGVADKVYGDNHGNSFAVLNPEGKTRVMLAGHIDEIGFQVNYISDEGFVYINTMGGFDTQIIPGRVVNIHTQNGPVKGVIGKKAIHLMTDDERKKVPEISDLWIDTGISDSKKVKEIIEIGDPITYDVGFEHLAEDVYVSRGVDDRIGAFIVGEVIRYLKNKKITPSVYAVATVQEELGLRGAQTSAYSVNPDVAFAVDVTFANTPDICKKKNGDKTLGGGPVVSRGPNFNAKLFNLVKKVAKDQKIDIQIDAAPRGTGTDANAIQLNRGGVAASLISIPNRYMHTPVEIFDMRDVKGAIKLIAECIIAIDNETDFIL